MGNDKKCPFCGGKRLKIIGSEIRETYRSFVSEVAYKCLDNEEHIFKCCKYVRMSEK